MLSTWTVICLFPGNLLLTFKPVIIKTSLFNCQIHIFGLYADVPFMEDLKACF